MTKNPILNALSATAYIALVALSINYAGKHVSHPDNQILAPIAFLSLFSLSVAVMGFLFLYQPFQMYFDGKKKQAVDFFLKTLFTFAVVTVLILFVVFSGLIG